MTRSPSELWFEDRKDTLASTPMLLNLIRSKKLTATPRFGVRNERHQHGSGPGECAVLRVRREGGQDMWTENVRIKTITSKPVREFTPQELRPTIFYSDWEAVRKELSRFAGYHLDAYERVSLVTFEYVDESEGGSYGTAQTAST